jgi:hypothetical protein
LLNHADCRSFLLSAVIVSTSRAPVGSGGKLSGKTLAHVTAQEATVYAAGAVVVDGAVPIFESHDWSTIASFARFGGY